jgi:hypothetical protein
MQRIRREQFATGSKAKCGGSALCEHQRQRSQGKVPTPCPRGRVASEACSRGPRSVGGTCTGENLPLELFLLWRAIPLGRVTLNTREIWLSGGGKRRREKTPRTVHGASVSNTFCGTDSSKSALQ